MQSTSPGGLLWSRNPSRRLSSYEYPYKTVSNSPPSGSLHNMDAVDDGSVPAQVQVFARALEEKYGVQCKTLEDKHLDQAIEQEVHTTCTKTYHPVVVLHAVVGSKQL